MNNFTDTLKRELLRLQSELQNDPRFRRITRIKELLAEYGDTGEPATPAAAEQPAVVHHLTAIGLGGSGRLRARSPKKNF